MKIIILLYLLFISGHVLSASFSFDPPNKVTGVSYVSYTLMCKIQDYPDTGHLEPLNLEVVE